MTESRNTEFAERLTELLPQAFAWEAQQSQLILQSGRRRIGQSATSDPVAGAKRSRAAVLQFERSRPERTS
jgi:hypothetical protein